MCSDCSDSVTCLLSLQTDKAIGAATAALFVFSKMNFDNTLIFLLALMINRRECHESENMKRTSC